MMSDDQSYFEQLRALDPALATGGAGVDDLAALKARVMLQTTSNVVPFVPRSGRLRMWRYASAAAVVAIAAGLGYAGGTARQAPSATIASPAPVMGLGGGSPNDTMAKAAGTPTGSYVAGYGGGIILQPEASMPNDAGQAQAYTFNVQGIDLSRLASGLAEVVGAKDTGPGPQSTIGSTSVSLRSADGRQNANVDVYGGVANVSAYNDARSPWVCTAVMTGSEGGATASTAPVKPRTKCTDRGPAPSSDDAVRNVQAAFMKLGIDPKGLARYEAVAAGMGGGASASVNVVVTPQVEGKSVPGASWFAAVSAAGIFSLNAWVANVEPLAKYPIVGARDVANRTLLARWNSLGAQWVRNANAMDGTASPQALATPGLVRVSGKPTVDAYVVQANVSLLSDGLQMRWLADGSAALMPAWLYRDAAGDEWSMLAISEQYVNWTAQAAGGPIAYDTAVGTGGTANSGTATVAAPTPLK